MGKLEDQLRYIRETLRAHALDRGLNERERENWLPIEDCTSVIKAVTAIRLRVEENPSAYAEIAAILDRKRSF